MPAVAAATQLAGAGISAYGDIVSANDQSKLDQDKAAVAQQQAAEIAARNTNNAALINQQAYRQKAQFASSYAASGKSGVGIGSQLQIQNQADQQNMIATREANFQEMMLNQQAGIDTTMSQEALTGGTFSAIGAVLGGGAGAAKSLSPSGGNQGTQGLGPYPDVGSLNIPSANLQMPALGAGHNF